MKMIKLFGLLLVLFTFVGCEDDSATPSCQNYAVNLGPFYLKESSANLFPYTKTDTNLVFKNALNEELVFTQSLLVRDTFKSSALDVCPFDSTLQVPYIRTVERIIASFRNDSLDLGFEFKFFASFRSNGDSVTGESDLAFASFSIPLPGIFINNVSSLITQKSGLANTTFNDFHSTITLGAMTFDSVYATQSIPNLHPLYIIYLNYDIGIVGFEETATGQVWVFDRIE